MTKNTLLKVNILTLFPDVFDCLKHSVIKRAIDNGIVDLNIVNIRDFATDSYKTVDDAPYGGGAGQLLKPDILGSAIDSVYKKGNGRIIYLSPRGRTFNQQVAGELAMVGEITFICGHYEGIDERVIEFYGIEELSLGDFVLSGGEVALVPIIDCITRLIPNVLGNESSKLDESFSLSLGGGLEYPQYTRPDVWQGLSVPDILKSGHHKNIREWQLKKSLELTKKLRPDLINKNLEN